MIFMVKIPPKELFLEQLKHFYFKKSKMQLVNSQVCYCEEIAQKHVKKHQIEIR